MCRDLYRFYLLEKNASGYVLIDDVELNGYPDDSVEIIEDAARTVIGKRLRLLSTVDIKVDVYQVVQSLIPVRPLLTVPQPPEEFGNYKMGPSELRKRLLEIFDDYYRGKCQQFLANSSLGELDHREHLIVVVCTIELRFFLFSPSSDTNTSIYLGNGKVIAGADQTVGVIEEAARKCVKTLTWSNVGVKIVRVVEVFELKVPLVLCLMILQPRGALLEEYRETARQLKDHDCRVNDDPEKVVLHQTTESLREISANDSLIVQFGL